MCRKKPTLGLSPFLDALFRLTLVTQWQKSGPEVVFIQSRLEGLCCALQNQLSVLKAVFRSYK